MGGGRGRGHWELCLNLLQVDLWHEGVVSGRGRGTATETRERERERE